MGLLQQTPWDKVRRLITVFVMLCGAKICVADVNANAADKSVTSPAPSSAKTAPAEEASRQLMARTLITEIGYEKMVSDSIDTGIKVFKANFEKKDEPYKKENKAAYEDAIKKYESNKSQLREQMLKHIENAFATRYSVVQLKYLIELSRNSLNKDFQKFLISSEVSDAFTLPIKSVLTSLPKKK